MSVKEINFYPTPYETNKQYNVSEATQILVKWGISINEKKTRDLILKKRLAAKRAGTDPNDRRSGYIITGKAIYDLIIEEIPIAKDILKNVVEPKKAKAQTKNRGKNTSKEEKPGKAEQLDIESV